MDFGKLDDISGVDFTLPADHPFTLQALQKHHTTIPHHPIITSPQVFIGPPIWNNKSWLGKIYPSTAKEKDFLYHYSRQFNTIELNVTHYQIPSKATVSRWRESTTEGFRFCPKWPQEISHDRQLKGCEALSESFVSAVLGLKEKLGTTFLQLGPMFAPKELKVLEHFLQYLPNGFPIAVEFRHADWFKDKILWADTLQMLQNCTAGTVISDVAGRRDVLHNSLTNSTLTLRFVGNELHPTDYTRVEEWVARLQQWWAQGLQTAYIFVHCGDNEFAPELTQYWIDQLNQKCNLQLTPPLIRPKVVQGSLF
ncbi:MAG: DUF72 domain-containing protein [Runella sp.]